MGNGVRKWGKGKASRVGFEGRLEGRLEQPLLGGRLEVRLEARLRG